MAVKFVQLYMCYNTDTNDTTKHLESESTSGKAKKPSAPILRFLYLLIAPVSGWKKMKNSGYSSDSVARNLFYPLLALMAAACFMTKLYQPDTPIGSILQMAVAQFVSLFAGFFAIMVLAHMFLPETSREKIETRFGKVFVMTILSALSLAATLYSLFPNLGALLIVVPIYVAYIIAKGVRFLRIDAKEQIPATIVMIILSMGVPSAIYFLLESLMPSV